MKLYLGIALVALASAGANVLAASTEDAAQAAWVKSKTLGPQGRSYDEIKRLPDWSGAWSLDDESFDKTREASGSLNMNSPNVAKLNEKWEAYRRGNGAMNGGHGPDGVGVLNNAIQCIPDGMPGMMTTPLTFEYLFTPGIVTIMSSNGESRRVFTDGRKHSADPDLKFSGESVGHWEGNTLVIDTQAILPKAEIFMGLPQEVGTHVVERIRKLNPHKLEIRTIVTNPKMFTQPWIYTRTFDHQSDITFDICQENNRDHGGEIDMTPPTEE